MAQPHWITNSKASIIKAVCSESPNFDLACRPYGKTEFVLVADVVRHLLALDFEIDSSDFGILTNSVTLKLNCAEVLETD
jgi:hypothetical protein